MAQFRRSNRIVRPFDSSQIRAWLSGMLLFGISGVAIAGADPCAAGIGASIAVSTEGAPGSYTVNGASNRNFTVVRGCSYTFMVSASGHPFLLKSVQGAGSGNQYNDGVANNGAQTGTITWTVAANAPGALFYNCQFHPPMTGTITVIDPDPALFGNGFEDTPPG
ncbi:hypothetical protein C7S18_10355 [Ahniella affigens]|uniref:Blue (type 1) copper domain-containing protein n=1 Tax=Ahniella affigens TaxID=2021234 RepID=A0A2P1PRW9_9GAMM|nr:hypothetical protein [Ahniella affigens]AVP97572.1 hypothetical protein C7S18_10355 [Ahniella affigens]